jgi:hypothetical protein
MADRQTAAPPHLTNLASQPVPERPELAHLFDEQLLTDYEKASLRRRLVRGAGMAERLVKVARHVGLPADHAPPVGFDAPARENVLRAVYEHVRAQGSESLKTRVARGVAEGICRHYIWSNASTLPIAHELTVIGPWLLVNRDRSPAFRELADWLSGELLNGIVLSLQRVEEEVLTAEEVYLGHCACRSAGVAQDLDQQGRVFTLLGEVDKALLLDRLMTRFDALGEDHLARTTGPKLRAVLERLGRLRSVGSSEYHLDNLLRWTYPDWELLPVRPGYTTRWVRSMRNNHKAEPIDRTLALELVHIWFFARGAVFNSMKCAGAQYTICSCPTPENEGGCVLTNWYYYGGMNRSLVPADDHHGRRRDAQGNVLPCRFFPVRARRSCIGCGCDHARPGPRDLRAALAHSDLLEASLTRDLG